jgi:hypothetical protein
MFGALTYKRPINLVMAANMAAYAVLFLYGQPFDNNALFMCLLVTGLICAVYYIIAGMEMGDEYLFLVVSMLFSLGLVMIYRLDRQLGQRQLIWFAVGLILFFTCYLLFYKGRFWNRLGLLYAAGTFLLNILTRCYVYKLEFSCCFRFIRNHIDSYWV